MEEYREQHFVNLRERRLWLAPLFLDAARALLTIQASSASDEGLFGDAGYQEGTRRQSTGSSVKEMLLTVRNYIVTQLKRAPQQLGFISSRRKTVKDHAEDLAGEIEDKDK